MIINPRSGYILMKMVDPAQEGAIHLPPTYKGQQLRAQVVAVGLDVHDIQVGDWLILDPEGGYTEANPNDDSLGLCHQDHVIATCVYEAADNEPRSMLVTNTTAVLA